MYEHIYIESFGDGGHMLERYYAWDSPAPPSDGDTATYTCLLDRSTARFHYYYRGTEIDARYSHHQPAFLDVSGDEAVWSGEILNTDDDLPGTASDPCFFRQMSVRVGNGGLMSIDTTVFDTCVSDDPGQWGIARLGPDEIKIWDVNPH